ncbi:patatin-like phospholipase family protein [Terasakiella pusilla]|uniref:patatin-like phospholipase family protein n=1 Tax=Terasakiella pusilla TaxID=64973 RepID=UPI003AA84936
MREGTGLALSGGGYRASLFQVGSLLRLNDAGMLPKIDEITSVSGGSITSAILALNWPQLTFDNNVATNLNEVVVTPLRQFVSKTADIPSGLKGIFNPFGSAAKELEAYYDKHLFSGKTMQDLSPEEKGRTPRFTFYATNLQTGVSVRMSKEYLADYTLGLWRNPTIKLAQVVAASSAFPPVFCPVKMKTPADQWQETDNTRYNDPALRRQMLLGDGGIYDNMGLERPWKKRSCLLVSDAGAPFALEQKFPLNWVSRLIRTTDILGEQSRALRKRSLMTAFEAKQIKEEPFSGTYWGIATQIKSYELEETLLNDSPENAAFAKIRTRLNTFTQDEQKKLINWAYALCDAALRKHLDPDLPIGKLPY